MMRYENGLIAALTYPMKTPEPIGQQGQWLNLLSKYDISIQHRPEGFMGTATRCQNDDVNATESHIAGNIEGKPLGPPQDWLMAP